MNRLEIPLKKIDVLYPSTWDEIPVQYAERVGEIMFRCFRGEIECIIAQKLIVDLFLNRVNKKRKGGVCASTENIHANEALICDSVGFLFSKEIQKQTRRNNSTKGSTDVEVTTINPKFYTQLLPVIKVGLHTYIGPNNLLSDITIFEFKEASWRVGKFASTRDFAFLDGLFAVLYRRKRIFGGNIRVNITDNDRKRANREKIASKIPVGIKFMIYLYFIGCMNWIRDESIEIDGQRICFGCLFPKGETQSSTDEGNTGMAGVLFQMAESGVFGTMEQTVKVNMWDVFLRLYQIHQEIKETKKSIG